MWSTFSLALLLRTVRMPMTMERRWITFWLEPNQTPKETSVYQVLRSQGWAVRTLFGTGLDDGRMKVSAMFERPYDAEHEDGGSSESQNVDYRADG